MAIGDPFGSLDSSPDDWQDQEAQANLAAQNQPESGVSTLWRAIRHPSLLPLIKSLTSSDGTSAQPPQNAGDAAMAQYFPEAFTVNPVAQNLATGVAGAIKSGATAPGRALSGELPMYGPDGHTSEAMIDAGNDMAGVAGGGSVASTLEHAAERAPVEPGGFLSRAVPLNPDNSIVHVDPAKVDALLHPVDRALVEPKLSNARDFIASEPDSWNPPQMEARTNRRGDDHLGIIDGIHRWAALRDTGAPAIPVEMDAASAKKARQMGITAYSDSAPGEAVSVAEHASEPFYSGLERAVTDTPQPKATGAQWLATIKNKPGVKPEEMDWTGVKDFLATNADKPVTKDQLLDHLEANKVQIGEKVLPRAPAWKDLPGQQQYDLADRWELPPHEAEEQYNEMLHAGDLDGQQGFARYGQYQLPGGESYREKLLTLPVQDNATREALVKRYGDLQNKAFDPERGLSDAEEHEMANLERLFKEGHPNQGVYQSGHWDEPNVLLHMRMTDRQVSGNGFTVQNQVSGRRSQVFPDQAAANAYIEQLPESLQRQVNIVPAQDTKKALHLEELQSDWHQTGRKNGYRPDQEKQMGDLVQQRDALTDQFHAMDPNDPARLDKIDEINKLHDQIADLGHSEPGVPDAPFRKTWHELGLKRALHEAAEGDYDRLSWTPGADHPTNPKNLGRKGPEADAADRGMQGFYDKIIPDYLNKVGKPHGVQVKQGAARLGHISDGQFERIPIDALDEDGNIRVHYIDINPSLRQHVLKGMPLFEDGKAGAATSVAEHLGAHDAEAARLARAEAQGFDTSKVWYHSALQPVDKFDPYGRFMGRSGVAGLHLTDNPKMASRYLDRFGNFDYEGKPFQKNVIPVYVKRGKVLEQQEPFKTSIGLGEPIPEGYKSPVEQAGYDALLRDEAINGRGEVKHVEPGFRGAIKGKEMILHDPSRVRSIFADFAPENAGKNGLLLENSKAGAAVSAAEHMPTPAPKLKGKKAANVDTPPAVQQAQALIADPNDKPYAGAKYPQYAEQMPPVGPPALTYKSTGKPVPKADMPKGKQLEKRLALPKDDPKGVYWAKQNTPEATAFQKERAKVMKDMATSGYEPYFPPEERSHVDPAHYPTSQDMRTEAVPAKPDTVEKWRKIYDTPESRDRLQKAYDAGKTTDSKDWYAMRQLEQQYIKHLGPEEGRQRFAKEFARTMAATTGGADPTSNYLLAHYTQWAADHGGIPEASHQLPFPIGGRYVSGNIDQFRKMDGPFNVKNPKRHDFEHAYLGHENKATTDEQMSNLIKPGMNEPDWYGLAAQVIHDMAAKNGVSPREFQEVAWAGAKKTSTEAAGKKFEYEGPMINHINKSIERTHRLTGMPKNEIVRRGVVKKEIPLYAGGVPFGALDARDKDQ